MSGLGIIKAGCLKDAILKLQNQKFDYVLLDLNLPDGSGVKILELVNKNKRTLLGKGIIIMSGYVEASLIAQYKNIISGVVVKPFQTEDLLKKMLLTPI